MTRDEAIKILQIKQIPQCGDREITIDEEYQALEMAIQALEMMDAPNGWISRNDGVNVWLECSKCGAICVDKTPFCPYCGEKMI